MLTCMQTPFVPPRRLATVVPEKSWANVRAMRVVLYLFAAMSSLKVNFHTNELVGVNVNQSWLLEEAAVLNCKVTIFLIMYLGLPIGGHSCRLNFWWSRCSSNACPDLVPSLCFFLLQSSLRYQLFY